MSELDAVVNGLTEAIEFLFRQPILVKLVTYSVYTKPEFDEANRIMEEVPTPASIYAIDVSSVVARFGEGVLQFGSTKADLIFRASDLSAPPTTRDKVTIDGAVRQISGMVPYLGVAYGVTLEGTS